MRMSCPELGSSQQSVSTDRALAKLVQPFARRPHVSVFRNQNRCTIATICLASLCIPLHVSRDSLFAISTYFSSVWTDSGARESIFGKWRKVQMTCRQWEPYRKSTVQHLRSQTRSLTVPCLDALPQQVGFSYKSYSSRGFNWLLPKLGCLHSHCVEEDLQRLYRCLAKVWELRRTYEIAKPTPTPPSKACERDDAVIKGSCTKQRA